MCRFSIDTIKPATARIIINSLYVLISISLLSSSGRRTAAALLAAWISILDCHYVPPGNGRAFYDPHQLISVERRTSQNWIYHSIRHGSFSFQIYSKQYLYYFNPYSLTEIANCKDLFILIAIPILNLTSKHFFSLDQLRRLDPAADRKGRLDISLFL